MEFLMENPLLELLMGLVSFFGVALLGWSNLMVDPPNLAVVMPAELNVWDRHQLRRAKKENISHY